MARRKVKLWKLFIPIVGQLYLFSLILDWLWGDEIVFDHDDEES